MRTMYDACTWQNLPPDGELVAYYVDGSCAIDAASVRARCPNSVLVPISAVGVNAGIVLDCEPGNLNAAQSVNWVMMRRAAGADPTVYVAQWAPGYTWADVLNAHEARGVTPPHIWVAPWPDFSVPEGAVAAQYAYPGPVDLSAVLDYWPGVDAGPPPPAPIPQEAISVQQFTTNTQPAIAALCPDGSVWVKWQDADGVWHTANGDQPVGTVDIRTGIAVDPAPRPGFTYVYGALAPRQVWVMWNATADWSSWSAEAI